MVFSALTEVIDLEPHRGAVNMAIDEVLLRGARTPLLRVYRWAEPAVSFGYFGDFSAVATRWPMRELVRRWTGGGEVPHGDDLTYTLIVPRSHPFAHVAAAESYRAIHACLAPLVRGAVVAENAGPQQSGACFENAVRSDIMLDERKVAGAAQRRTAHGLLHQGSVQASGVLDSVRPRLARTFASRNTARLLLPEELAGAHDLAALKYGTQAWLRRFDSAVPAPDQVIPCATRRPC